MSEHTEIEEKLKKLKTPKRLEKNVLNVIRTTMRNNIELTTIADNKANVLLSLNALMLTFLLPVIVPNFDFIQEKQLGLSIGILVLTCLITIYLSAITLKPGDFDKLGDEVKKGRFVSPFFFGNTHKMTIHEFEDYIENALSEEFLVKMHITEDLYYVGKRLGEKMTVIRSAFVIFLSGLILSVLIAAVMLLIVN